MKSRIFAVATVLLAQLVISLPAHAHDISMPGADVGLSPLQTLARNAIRAEVASYPGECLVDGSAAEDGARYSYPDRRYDCLDPVATGSAENRAWWSRWVNHAE